jgi:hypothetical protein
MESSMEQAHSVTKLDDSVWRGWIEKSRQRSREKTRRRIRVCAVLIALLAALAAIVFLRSW